MSNRNNDVPKNGLSITKIETSDTISQFMEKCNNNFFNLLQYGGGTKGDDGAKGDQGVPTKPKVPIHVWKKGEQYSDETITSTGESIIDGYSDDELQDVKYQEGHLIILESAHIYILEINEDDGKLKPKFILELQSCDPIQIVNTIDKDCIEVSDGINTLKLDTDGVEMSAKTGNSPDEFYGWKVTSTGIYFCNGGTDWVKWDSPTATNIE